MFGLRKLLTIFSIGLLVGAAHLFCSNYELAKRVFSVQPTPSVVTYRQLVEYGTPPSNCYIQVMNSWVGTKPSGELDAQNNEWKYGVLPVFETRIRREGDGRHVRLLARFDDTHNAGQLKRRALQRDIKGCIWEDAELDASVKEMVKRNYPGIDFTQCRILDCGDPPVAADVANQQKIVIGLLIAGLVTAVLSMGLGMVQRLRVTRFCEESNPYVSKIGTEARIAQYDDTQRSFRELALTKFLPLIAGLSYAGYKFVQVGFLTEGAAVGLGVLSLSGIIGLAILAACNRSRYLELSYDILREEEIQRSDKWEELTSRLESMGFVRSMDVSCRGADKPIAQRLFCSGNRKHVAVIEGGDRVPLLWFGTICSDGALIKSSTGKKLKVHSAIPLRFHSISWNLEEEIKKHLGIVEACKEVRFVDPVMINADSLIGFLDYHHRLLGWLEHKRRRLIVPPAALPTPNDFMRTNDRTQEKYFGWTAPRANGKFRHPVSV